MASGFKRLGLALVIALVAGVGILAGMGALVSADAVRERVKTELRRATGFDLAFRDIGTVSLFPSGSVSFAGVALGDGPHSALTAERLIARLQIFPMLFGHVVVSDVTLERPQININISADGRSNWSNLLAALRRGQKPGAATAASPSEIRIHNGTIHYRDEARKIDERFDDAELSLAWPLISKSFGATGRFRWHDEPLDASITMSDFAAALAGNRTGLKLRLSGVPFKAAFDGAISMNPTLKIDGTLAADAASLRDALIWTGQKPFPGGGFGRFALKAKADVVGGTIALSGVNVEIDGNSAEGVLTFATDGRQTLQGTLAAETLDLTPYIAAVRLLTSNQREWDNARLSLDGMTGFDVDLRLSAASVVLPKTKLGRTAVGANLRGGHLHVNIGESQGFDGIIKGSFALANFETGVDVKAQMQFTNVDLSACLGQLFGLRRLEGKGNVAVALEGSGDSVLAVTKTLTGTASITGQNGALTGLNVEQLLRRLERRPLSGGGSFRTGHTPYDRLAFTLKLANGTATVIDGQISGPSVRLALEGSASIPSRELALKGTASLLSGSAQNTAFELPFIVEGSWDDPIMLPDPQILIRRSGAAAPLLNAVRNRGARDAIQSAIDRLTGGPPAAGSAPAAAEQPAKTAE